ncbi:DEAD/DEAH box helicase [Sorangium atrum]|uniref:DEAD/DEAH box helicase n=1 Tax=Sorangium atrum TaxID=2995308 RepID=A0ABT5C8B4_9BACT|nr:DEAD/DEAH box helicase [Sorangium aterium]MDC0682625.1 DEAD/DEAH box helicase [Sorangium aterium]
MNDPFLTFNELRSAYLRYLDSPFRLRYPALMEERRDLLDQDRQLYRNPLFEPIVPYESSGMTVRAACRHLGAPQEVAEYVESGGLFPAGRELFQHQLDAWKASRAGEAVVVTTGTGSGKTECYLLPVFAALVEESATWGAPAAPSARALWWNFRKQQRIPQRAHDTGRAKALRALFLYPLNALIEDQLGRIRRACDSPDGRTWLSMKRSGNRYWFGRYTGSTPVSGPQTNPSKRQELKRRLKEMESEWGRAQLSAARSANDDVLSYFQDPQGSEMWSRWDMQEDPPDILITNYSMLNIMLMRSIEGTIFDQTRTWLASDRTRNHFHLIVDELHTYRGTPGTEVGYLLRALLHRLGLTPDSPQLRIIATSASMEANDPDSLEYLEQFFGRDRKSFRIIDGNRATFPIGGTAPGPSSFCLFARRLEAGDLNQAVAGLALDAGVNSAGTTAEQKLGDVLAQTGILERVRQEGASAPFTLSRLAAALFGAVPDAPEAARAVVRALVAARQPRGGANVAPLPLRVHYFFHNAGRLWVCVNPACTGRKRTTLRGAPTPPVGRFYVEPRPRCDSCNARVLELLYCQPCGEVFIGGYRDEDDNTNNAWFLSPDFPDLNHVPDRSASLDRTHGEYLVFWPAGTTPLVRSTHAGPSWRWQQDGQAGYQWCPASLDIIEGRLSINPGRRSAGSNDVAGYAFTAPVDDAEAFPAKCPHCAADWGRRLGVKSPIRDLGSGFQRIMQILGDAVVREMPPGPARKLVLFSDSRLDAAKLSTGIKLAHYRDTLRQIAFTLLGEAGAASLRQHQQQLTVHAQAVELHNLLRKREDEGLSEPENQRRKELMTALPGDVVGDLSRHAATGGPQPGMLRAPVPPGPLMFMTFRQVLDLVRQRLLALGMNPGGPLPSVSRYQPQRQGPKVVWTELIDWSASPPAYKAGLQPLEQNLQARIENSFRASVISSVFFASAARDFESLGLGYLWTGNAPPATPTEQAAASVVRMLAQKWRWTGGDAQGRGQPPEYVSTFLEQVAPPLGMTANDLQRDVVRVLGACLGQWLVDPDSFTVVSPRPDASGNIDVYVCTRCGCSHLHASAGYCTACRGQLPPNPASHSTRGLPSDYYEYLARCADAPFRLNCEELTGQTNRIDRRLRQRRFQEVFMADEVEIATGVDLLSVTTTMEAGVDIGALQAIALANMPPVRFNYQQRVGRAGRRGLGMSAALTLCRGRSHDDYYFERPWLITAEPPPPPYVDVTRPEIAKRVVNKEVLRRAFEPLQLPYSGDNVHGEFGSVSDWSGYRGAVAAWVSVNAQIIQDVCRAVVRRTALDTATDIAAMVQHVTNDLLRAIDAVAQNSMGHHALSERLASHGVLPMFGFPTRVRYLFHGGPPSADGGWPPERGIVDRQLDIAISQFAPGAQTVKDDELLTSVGVVDYFPAGGSVQTSPDPLGNPVQVGICRRCQALVETPAPIGGCPFCAAPRTRNDYRTVDLSEPPGFMTWWAAEAEYNGAFEFTPRALRARMGRAPGSPTHRLNFEVDRGPARIHRVNDNGGDDFVFQKVVVGDIWVVDQAFQRALQDLPTDRQRAVRGPQYDTTAAPLTRALASIANTDVLVAGIKRAPVGVTLNPANPEARAAWYSFGFLARRAAAVVLDVAESELDVGIQPLMDMRTPFAPPSARIFVSDSLENGAGYSTHLGTPAEFEKLLHFMLGNGGPQSRTFYDPIVSSPHEDECSNSCHRCLREYGNMPYHPLLDWRLALDMVRLALDPAAPIDLAQPYWATLVQRTAALYFQGLAYTQVTLAGLPAGHDPGRGEVLILIHPLWDQDPSNFCAEVSSAVAQAEARGWTWKLRTVFRAVRFPYE